ncbi:MurR/RpiR family transcriptional regulator [Labrys monachus]|uniref:DNA-binding MurR/RpiR family transcriptional regulator n=1 Tax=Labrys monachus TaxID=217067 RepID=A0ABU0FNB5_9HYPH|nr:MurR/RpiR family transcriptional regulator [Labrys monachus]MDQ0395553.1 DNA-binding MurR/RpiR family transcriptional regulator [Labrys monachus]
MQGTEITRRIDALRGGLNPTLRRVADLVLDRTSEAKAMSIKELAEACRVSQSSVSRFVRAVGAESYQDFRIMLAEGLTRSVGANRTGEPSVYEGIAPGDDAAAIIAKVARRQAEIIQAASISLDPVQLQRAADLVAAHDTLVFFGVGSSLLAAEDGVMRFLRIGKACVYNRDANIQMFSVAGLAGRAVAIGISESGRTRSTVEAVREAAALGMPSIAITSAAGSPLARSADAVLLTPGAAPEPTGGEGMYESMVSKMAQLAAMDALYALVAVQDHQRALARLDYTDAVIVRSRLK